MKRFVFIFLGFVMISDISFSQFKLNIEITEIRNNSGNIMFQLFDEISKSHKGRKEHYY